MLGRISGQYIVTIRLPAWNSQCGVELPRDDQVIEDLLPVLVYGCLAISNVTNTLLHQRANVEVVCVSGVGSNDTDTAALLHRHDRLVRNLGDVRLEHERLLNLVQQRLRLMEGTYTKSNEIPARSKAPPSMLTAIQGNVETTRSDFLNALHNILVLREVDDFATILLRLLETLRDPVNANDARCALELRELGGAETNRTETLGACEVSKCSRLPRHPYTYPNAYNIARLHTSVHDAMVSSAQDVRQVQRLLVRDFVGNREQVDVALRYTDVLSLTTCEASGEVGVTKEACITVAVHGILQPVDMSVPHD